MKNRILEILLRVIFPLIILVTWQVLSRLSANPFFPAPSRIYRAVKFVYTADWVRDSLFLTIYTLVSGFILGSIAGIASGTMLGSQKFAREIFTPIANFIRSIPSVAKIPVIMALFGLGLATRVTTVAIAVFFPVLMTTMRAVAGIDPQVLEYSKLFKFGYFRSLVQIRIPAATGEILAGLQAAIQIAVLVVVVSEMLGSARGLGAFIIKSQSTYMITDMWVGIVTLGILGVILNEGFQLLERRIAPWYFASKGLR
jgi:ABC-type nitrate/sulfonate/bicarbonate transport system permease component